MPKRLPFEYENLGERQAKGFDEPIRVYAVNLKPGSTVPESETATQLESIAPDFPNKPSIAVLPFENMSGDPEQEYFSDGISEDLTTALQGLFEQTGGRRAAQYRGLVEDGSRAR